MVHLYLYHMYHNCGTSVVHKRPWAISNWFKIVITKNMNKIHDSLSNHLKMMWFHGTTSNTSITSLWGYICTNIIMTHRDMKKNLIFIHDSLSNHLKMRRFHVTTSNTSITSLWGYFCTNIIRTHRQGYEKNLIFIIEVMTFTWPLNDFWPAKWALSLTTMTEP